MAGGGRFAAQQRPLQPQAKDARRTSKAPKSLSSRPTGEPQDFLPLQKRSAKTEKEQQRRRNQLRPDHCCRFHQLRQQQTRQTTHKSSLTSTFTSVESTVPCSGPRRDNSLTRCARVETLSLLTRLPRHPGQKPRVHRVTAPAARATSLIASTYTLPLLPTPSLLGRLGISPGSVASSRCRVPRCLSIVPIRV